MLISNFKATVALSSFNMQIVSENLAIKIRIVNRLTDSNTFIYQKAVHSQLFCFVV